MLVNSKHLTPECTECMRGYKKNTNGKIQLRGLCENSGRGNKLRRSIDFHAVGELSRRTEQYYQLDSRQLGSYE
ncbi:MAG: hypothetical protein GY820_13565 [Gammaproteobacteria bacterium]|nr:hypothetical protein [Gammaproteobacteria bacterium]